MQPSERGTVAASDGLPVHFAAYGAAGPALVLVHGWSCHARVWDAQLAALAATYVVIVIDLPGHGASHAGSAERAWSMAAYGRDVVSVLDVLGAERVAIVGHSMGGPVALEAGIALGERCALVLGVDTLTETTFYTERPAAEIAARCEPFVADFAGRIRAMVADITHASTDRATVARIAAMMASNDPAVAVPVLGALLAWDAVERRPRYDGPIETINSAMLARRDEFLPLPEVTVHEMEGVGHFPMLEDPAAFNARMLEILARRYPA